MCSLGKDLDKLNSEFYDLTDFSILSDFENLGCKKNAPESKIIEKTPKISLARNVDNPVNVRERVNWIEIRLQDFEKTISLINRNLNDLRNDCNKRIEKIENLEKISPEVRSELSSLKSLIGKNMGVSEELKTKMPVFLRELEGKVNIIGKKMKNVEDSYLYGPTILE